ncbi:MAG: class III extradiol ring-cleavage dioxygenase [Steroidobacteraceae bacterium]
MHLINYALGPQLSGVQALLVVSAHWQTREVRVMTNPRPPTVHDFGGFSRALYELQYPAAGAPELAAQATHRLADADYAVRSDQQRGLDHGVWVPLLVAIGATRDAEPVALIEGGISYGMLSTDGFVWGHPAGAAHPPRAARAGIAQ